VNGSWRRNKQKAFTFVSTQARHYFCIISSHETERVEAFVLAAFLCFQPKADRRFFGGTKKGKKKQHNWRNSGLK